MSLRIALLGVALAAAPLWAQTDYRNLDRGRPFAVEDAYPIERHAFELSAGQRLGMGRFSSDLEAGLGYGVGRGATLALAIPVVLQGGGAGERSGLAGIAASYFANVRTERPGFPALAIRGDALLPVGAAGPSSLLGGLTLLGTMSIGRSRLNLSAGAGIGGAVWRGGSEGMPLWQLGAEVDRTLIRSSTLVGAEVVLRRARNGEPVEFAPALGIRRQIATTLAVDAAIGVTVAAGQAGRSHLTLGLSHPFGIAALLPGGAR